MFFPRYNFSRGQSRPARKRMAAMSTARPKYQKRTADFGFGNMYGAGGGHTQFYSPVWDRAEDPTLAEEFLPGDTQTQNKLFRKIRVSDPVASPATEYWRDMAFSRFIRLGNIKDKKILRLYEDCIDASGVATEMPWMLDDYLTFGRYTLQMVWNEYKGYWDQLIIHDPDYVEVILSPFPKDDPIVNVQPNNEYRNWAVSRDPRIEKARQNYDPEVIKLMALGDTYPLQPEHTLFMARRSYAADHFGTSYFTRILPFMVMEKALIDAEIAAARRRAGPVGIITVPEYYEAEEIQEIIDQFFAVEADPIAGKVAVREGVTVNPFGGGKADFWTLSDEYDFIKNAKLNALGISEQFLAGEASYSSMEKVLQIFVEKLRAVRTLFTEQVVVNKMLKGLARIHNFVEKPQTQVAHHYRIARKRVSDADLIVPPVEWDRPLEPQADLDYWDFLERLEQKNIIIPKRRWAQAAGYDFDETIRNAAGDLADRAELYKIKAAQAEQAAEAGFDMEGNYIGEEAAIGGGPGLGSFGPGAEEGPPFELGPGEEFEAPPAELELPAPEEAPAPAEEGAGAALEHARFPVSTRPVHRRYATVDDYVDLERALEDVDIWDRHGYVMGLTRRQVAAQLDRIAHQPMQEREGRHIRRKLYHQGLSGAQSGIIQYCATRLGFISKPSIDNDTIRFLQHVLVDKANQQGITKRLNHELEILASVERKREKVPAAGFRNFTSRQTNLPDHQILTGVL